MRSDSFAHSGSATSATTLDAITIHSRVGRSRPTASLVPWASDQVPTIVLTTETSAHRITRITEAQWLRRRTATGSLATAWFSSTRSNSGVSGRDRRTQYPTATTKADRKNGIRQPQLSSWSSGSSATSRNTRLARIRPPCVPSSVKLVKNPRRLSGACSSVKELAPLCSPAADRPCRIRRRTRMAGAATPIAS
jgi:hypothetical protein